MLRRVYIETSVWGMTVPGQNPALRQPTLQFLQQCKQRLFLPCISDVVTDEVRKAPTRIKDAILDRIADLSPELLSYTSEVEELADRFITQGVLPPRRKDDGRHIACALVHRVDVVVSWNYRHLANVRKAEAFNAVATLQGTHSGVEIHTPLEVLKWK